VATGWQRPGLDSRIRGLESLQLSFRKRSGFVRRNAVRVCFGDCVADFDARELFLAGKPVHVEPRAFRLLELLIAARPRALSKQELQEALWPNTYVTERSAARLVADLRKALDDRGKVPKFIRTVHRFGYSFCAQADPVRRGTGRDMVFKLLWADREIALQEGENILGRERDAAAWIDVYSVSRRHARIVVSGDGATLEDLGSKNGTFVKGEAVTKPRPLKDGDRIRIGTVEMTVRRYAGAVSTQSVRTR
jgi:DNA-binding winged helix-turn-helix (wHTH) protein